MFNYTITVREIAARVSSPAVAVELRYLADTYIGIDLGDAVWCATEAVKGEPNAEAFTAQLNALLAPPPAPPAPPFNRDAYIAAQARKFA